MGRNLDLIASVPGYCLPLTYYIKITCPCNEYPLTPHFYIVKLGFTWVYIFSSESYHFDNREILLYIARTCLRNDRLILGEIISMYTSIQTE